MNKQYDYLIVGAGIYGASFACMAHRHGKRCLVIDKRNHLGGNIYCENIEGINVHKYGAHIFHTSNKKVWEFVNDIVEFNRYTNSPIANYKGKQYNLPFNMNTFYQMWGVVTPAEAQAKIEEQRQEALERMKADGVTEPRNLEEQAQLMIGNDIYEILIKGYTEKPTIRRMLLTRLQMSWKYMSRTSASTVVLSQVCSCVSVTCATATATLGITAAVLSSRAG